MSRSAEAESRFSSLSLLLPDSDVRLRFLRWWRPSLSRFAQSGVGFRLSKCCCRRRIYSFPLTKSSFSLTRSFRRRLSVANETTRRSSSLSTHAGPSSSTGTSCNASFSCRKGADCAPSGVMPVSIKKSLDISYALQIEEGMLTSSSRSSPKLPSSAEDSPSPDRRLLESSS